MADRDYLSEAIHEFEQTGMLCDVEVEVEGNVFPCHKMMLSATMPYFQLDDVEFFVDRIYLPEFVTSVAFTELLRYAYRSEVKLTESNVVEVCHAACILMQPDVAEMCRVFVGKHLNPDNCNRILEAVKRFNCDPLLELVQPFVNKRGTASSSDHQVDSDGVVIELADRQDYQILDPQGIVACMNGTIEEVRQMIDLSPTVIRILLSEFKWDKENLLEKYFANPEKVFQAAKIADPSKRSGGALAFLGQLRSSLFCPSNNSPAKQKEECQVCREETAAADFFSLSCGHRFCRQCWVGYLTEKITAEGIGAAVIRCLHPKCPVVVDDKVVFDLVQEEEIRLRYQQIVVSSFVEFNSFMRWCPSSSCQNAVKIEQIPEWHSIRCSCGYRFCSSCRANSHEPISCEMFKRWQKRCAEDSAMASWITTIDSGSWMWMSNNAKECPKCHANIEKSGGCNHMTCQQCRYEFCWLCLGCWPHAKGGCNSYDMDAAAVARQQQNLERAEHERFNFYSSRYKAHLESAKLEEKQLHEKIEEISEMVRQTQQLLDSEFRNLFFKRAEEVLRHCRHTLMYTYTFAFYLRKNNQVEIFEDNQKHLESETEKLSEMLEQELSAANASETQMRKLLLNKYVHCDQRRQQLLNHVRDGNDGDWWEYVQG